ncbi:thermonuclease [Bacillus sp. FJAT-42376]|nr:thermonuclease [Bacillus sp. FJAT-42376]
MTFAILFSLFASGCSVQEMEAGQAGEKDEAPVKPESDLPLESEHGEQQETKGQTMKAAVISVTDGDTIKVRLKDGKTEKVRFILVDTPESRGKYQGHPQPFAKEASDYTKKQLLGKDIELEPGVEERDRFGRLLAYIWMDGTLFNERLLNEGFARVAIYPPNTKYLDQFERIEKQAKEEKRKIWSLENYATDRGFTQSVRQKEAAQPDSQPGKVPFDPKGPDRDCGDFETHEEAQAFFEAAGPGDPHQLDRDGDGLACVK